MILTASLDHYLDTVWCVVASPFVTEYGIGESSMGARARLSAPQRVPGYQYLAVLANELGLEDAQQLTQHLQGAIRASSPKSVLRRKYRALPPVSATMRVGTHRHYVYLAWRWDEVSA